MVDVSNLKNLSEEIKNLKETLLSMLEDSLDNKSDEYLKKMRDLSIELNNKKMSLQKERLLAYEKFVEYIALNCMDPLTGDIGKYCESCGDRNCTKSNPMCFPMESAAFIDVIDHL